jgi:hypothetical protein
MLRESFLAKQMQSDEALRRYDAQSNRNMELLCQLSELDAQTADYNVKMAVLKQGLQQFGELKENWHGLVMFFQSLADLVNVPMSKQVDGMELGIRRL